MSDRGQKQAAIVLRRERVGELHLQGMTAQAIAKVLGVSRRTIDRDLAVALEMWRASREEALQQAQARELEILRLLQREAWLGWQRSQEEGVSEKLSKAEEEKQPAAGRATGSGGAAGVKKRAERTTKSQHGDPRFLLLVMKCIERRARLLDGTAPSEDFMTGARITAGDVLDELGADPDFLDFCRERGDGVAQAAS